MTVHDSSFIPPHDPPFQSQSPSVSRRRRALSTASARSSISTIKHSTSPRVTFTAAPLSPDATGVKNITRKVIRTLEGLGHLDSVDMHEQDCDLDDRLGECQVASTVNGSAQHPVFISQPLHDLSRHPSILTNGTASPSHISISNSARPVNHKIDWEIPRKILHSSIGFFTVYFYISESDVTTIVLVLWTALAVIVPADILRLRYPRFERIYERYLGFLMRESEKKSVNGVVWYILGVNFVLSCYPQDVATVAILILSWADTAASTFGRLFGSRTPPLPSRVPILRLPFAPRKSSAGFIAATLTGAFIAVGFWGWIAPIRNNGVDVSWSWSGGVRLESTLLSHLRYSGLGLAGAAGWPGLSAMGLLAGLVSGVAEALDLGSLDDNLTLPIISGGCILGFLKLIGLFSSPAS